MGQTRALPIKKKTKALNGILKTALETLKGILSNDKKFLAPQLLRNPYESAEKQEKNVQNKVCAPLIFHPLTLK